MSGFVHLHCHSTWSLLDGAIPAEVLPHAAAALGFEAVALTDHDSLLGAVRFARGCRAAGIKPIYGAELTVGSDHVTALARDARGYANLCRLISGAHLSNERGRPQTTFEAIAERAEGLFVLSGCRRGEVARLAAAGDLPEAAATARRWRAALGDGYRIEAFDHRAYGDRTLRDRLLEVANETGIPAVASNNYHYATPDDAAVHEVLHAIKEIVPLSRTHALRATSEYFLKPADAMRALFADAPEVLEETMRIAEACEFDLDLGTYHFPNVPIPAGETPTGLLARRCFDGARRRYGKVSRAVDDRLQHELSLIFRMGFAAFFLLVADIVDHVRHEMGVRCACRGSAAGSLVCYVLGISDVDPVRYDLLFERFMNERREELPDIDLDVESHRREDVLQHILVTYGAEQTAICCMVDTFRARMAIRDVGKALGLPDGEIDTVAKAFPHVRASDIGAAVERLPELAGTNLRAGQLEQLFELCAAVDGFPRHLALHPSGVILSSPDLADRVPMQTSFQGFTMLQADKDDVEELGLPKLDVLGVRMLSSIAHAVGEIARTRSVDVDLDAVPRDDDKTFALIRSSRTIGCFQIESPGQRELLARLQPDCFEDLIVDISLFRPGPVKSDMVTPFLNRRHGFEETRYVHERLKPILAETNGVVVYHEQVIRVIAAVTGCSLDEADYVRRHLEPEAVIDGVAGPIGLTPPDSDTGRWFKGRAVDSGFTHAQAERLWREVFSFASFGFCKSHAAAFALPTYLSSWLKAHYPAEFLAGVLTHDPGMYPRRLIVSDARQLGIPILPIDVNASDKTYRAEPIPPPGDEERDRRAPRGRAGDDTEHVAEERAVPGERLKNGVEPGAGSLAPQAYGIRLALSEVRGISDAEIDALLATRAERPFDSLEDLWRRAEPSQPVLENLVHVGAFDSVTGGRSRRELLWRAVDLARPNRSPRRAVRTNERQLALELDEPIQEMLPGIGSYTPLEETEAELDVSGMDARRHLMDLYTPLAHELGCTPAAHLRRRRSDSEVWVAGVKVASQTPAIRSGQRIIFVTLDDPTGPIDVTVFERVQPRCARTVFHSWLLLIKGFVRKRGGASFRHRTDPNNIGITVVVDEVFDLAQVASDRAAGSSLAEALNAQRATQQLAALTAPGGDLKPAARLWHSSGGSAGR